jgi:flagellar biosynthesis/type III secretory pathway M-ring protein FliF/YscJ
MEAVLAGIVLALVVLWVVARPLRATEARERVEDDRRAALEAAKEAKYRDIRDAELDYRMGKLSEEDWRVTDRELRAQAIVILHELDRLPGDGRDPADPG